MSWVDAEQPRLRLRTYGDEGASYALLLVHGTAGHGGVYEEFARAMASRGALVHCIDLRGHGESEGARGRFTMHGLIEDVRRAVRALRSSGLPIVVMGASQGGEVAFRAASGEPGVAGIVCLNVLLTSEVPQRAGIRFMRSKSAGVIARVFGDALRVPLRSVIDFEGAYRERPGLLREKAADPSYVWSYGFASYRSVFNHEPERPAADNETPVLLAVGERDPVISAEHVRLCFDAIGGPKDLWVVARAGHQPMMFMPRAFADGVHSWITRRVLEGDDTTPWSAPVHAPTLLRFLDAAEASHDRPEPGYRLTMLDRALAWISNGRVDRGVEFFSIAGPTELGAFVASVVSRIDVAAWELLRAHLPPRTRRVLVVGCGDGAGLAAILEADPTLRDVSFVGLDVDEPAIERARQRSWPVEAAFVTGDVRSWGGDGRGPFDLVYAHGIFDHCDDHDAVLSNAARLLRDGGAFMYVTPDRNIATWLRYVAVGPRFVFGLGHFSGLHDYRRFPRPAELDAKLEAAGLEPVRSEGAPWHRGVGYAVGPLGIVRAVKRRDITTIGFRDDPPRWWLGGGYDGEYVGVAIRRA